MFKHHMVLAAAAALLLVSASGCPPESSTPVRVCGPSNCNGCCALDGSCMAGTALSACGAQGGQCLSCSSTQTCQAGQCKANGGPKCSATNCGGCCAGDQCVPGTQVGACGRDGMACQVCSSGETCAAGTCGRICNATTCSDGCCSNGQCIRGGQQNVQTCGAGGQACKPCGNGEQCTNQVCTTTACNATTCPAGCCDATGNCKNGSTNNACGLGGGQCAICDTTKNETCQTGVCKAINPTCNATTCPKGCCDDTGACVPGTASANCGKGGQACSQCGSNLACVLQKCSCTATSCSGCCEGDVCKAGSDVAACGTAGAVCVKCQVPKKCVSGQCLEDCSFLTCPGCCNGTTCMDPTNVSNCGAYGSQCTQCGGSDVCEKGTCNDATKCSKTNCPNGCCKDGVCQVGTLNGACGEGGDTCELCGEHLYCGVDPYWGTQECLANNASTWDVIVSKVVLDANPAKPWDSFLEKPGPDVFVEITVGGKTGRTSVKNNEFTPVFDEFVLTASAKDLGTKIRYEIRDDDTFGSDLIGDCTDVIYPSELKNGYIEISGCGGKPTNKDVISVSFKFVVKSK